MAKTRCGWAGSNPLMIKYHDEEWGRPQHDDRRHFEFLILEAAQAGLSWAIVLNKREGYRAAFAQFDPRKVSRFDSARIRKLIRNSKIIRNRLKIRAAVNNAKAFLRVQEEFGSFDRYAWGFVKGKTIMGMRRSLKQIPAMTRESDAFSKDLKARGFTFVGSTVIYSHMQAVGMVNDHTRDCFRYPARSGSKQRS